jgi:hypothetical protein
MKQSHLTTKNHPGLDGFHVSSPARFFTALSHCEQTTIKFEALIRIETAHRMRNASFEEYPTK